MLDIKLIREKPDYVKEGLQKKGADVALVDQVIVLDEKRRELIQQIDTLRAKKNIAEEKLVRTPNEAKKDILDVLRQAKTVLEDKEIELNEIETEFKRLMSLIPNLPLATVPVGHDEKDNVVLREVGNKPRFNFQPLDYLTLAEKLDIIDVKRAAKTSGSRFGFLKNEGALLEMALMKFAFDKLTKKGFLPVIPPVMIKPEAMWAMGYLDRGAEEVYYLPKDDLYLIGTSEQIIGAMHQNESFQRNELPKRYISFSTCFRREAGSYGKDTKGILRVHQFDKAEMFIFTTPEEAQKEHEFLLSLEEELMQSLGLPYRVLNICSGDLGDPAAAKFDIEAWMPGQNEGQGQYRETHSTSNCTDYQARRLNIKYKNEKTNTWEFVYTLNGTAFSQRPILAIIENCQTKEGFVRIPKVLLPYMNGIKIIKR
ncbi:MAG: serine--tRNA ligase, partial [Parcubacteria group bacterium]|nr:serine--tRNA ligase [Parcubacteria group bacterium]